MDGESSASNYSDVGEPIDDLRYLCNDYEDDMVPDECMLSNTQVPMQVDDVVEKAPRKSNDVQAAIEALKKLCDHHGIIYTLAMENQIKTIMETEEIFESHLTWYIRGIIMASQTQLLPAINESLASLSAEIKYLQQSANHANNAIGKMTLVSKTLTDDIKGAAITVTDSFTKTLLHVSNMSGKDNCIKPVEQEVYKCEPSAPPVNISVSAISHEELKGKGAVETIADDSGLADMKKKFLISLGIDSDLIRNLPSEDVQLMISDQDYMEFKDMKLSDAERDDLAEVIIEEFAKLIEDTTE